MMNQASEFVIPSNKGELIRTNAPLIERLFNVGLEFTTDQNTAKRTGSEWIKINGIPQARYNAEEFTKGISNPETRFFFPIPEDLQSHFSWKSDAILWNVQRCSNAVVQNDNPTKIAIQGSQIAVAKAISLLDEHANALRHSKDMQQFKVQQEDQLCYYTQPSFRTQVNAPAMNHFHMNPYANNLPAPEIISRGSKPLPYANQNQYQSNGSGPQKVNSNLIDFAIKLGYTSDQVENAIQKCRNNINENSLLQQLTTLYPCRYTLTPAPVVSSKIVKDSSAADVQNNDDINAEVVTNVLPIDGIAMRKNNDTASKSDLRHIVIDGSNVAMSHGNREVFSCKGIQICVDYFKKRNHTEITVFVPQWRKEASKPDRPIVDQQILLDLEKERILVFTPSRRVNGRRVVCYDDRYIVKFAADNDGIIVSNDNFRDLEKENPEWKQVIEQRLLMYTFVKDCFMPPDDPLGRHGPKLDEFLKKGTVVQPRLCPYKKKCTYGHKCKFFHPERTQLDSEPKNQNSQSRCTVENSKRNNFVLYPNKNNVATNKLSNNTTHDIKYNNTRENQQNSNSVPTQAYQTSPWQNETSLQCPDKKLQQQIPDWNSRPNNAVHKGSSPLPSHRRSPEIQQTLQSIFPDKQEAIATLLQENPQETDINKLVNLMLK